MASEPVTPPNPDDLNSVVRLFEWGRDHGLDAVWWFWIVAIPAVLAAIWKAASFLTGVKATQEEHGREIAALKESRIDLDRRLSDLPTRDEMNSGFARMEHMMAMLVGSFSRKAE
jgi:hypothetical protein